MPVVCPPGGMLRLQIDRCIKPWVPCERAAILPMQNKWNTGAIIKLRSIGLTAQNLARSSPSPPYVKTLDGLANKLAFRWATHLPALALILVELKFARKSFIVHRNSTFGSPLFRKFALSCVDLRVRYTASSPSFSLL